MSPHLPGFVVAGATVGAALAVGVSERAVEQRQLPHLAAAQVVLAVRHLHRLSDDLADPADGALHVLRVDGRDERVQRLVLARHGQTVAAAHLPLLYRALAADDDLGARLVLQRCRAGRASGALTRSRPLVVVVMVLSCYVLK